MTKPVYSYQAATALYLGRRDNQEDAIATDFTIGEDIGFVVLSDGMGGHNAGDIASKVVVTEVFSELKLHSGNPGTFRSNIRDILLNAVEIANTCVGDVASCAPEAHGMGATLTVPVFLGDQLFWISIGDSPLYLYRSGHLRQLNEDHSMAPHIDLMVRTGMLAESIGRDHPDRNCLTSVLLGVPISKIDCPEKPTQLFEGDIIIAASDGLQYLKHTDLRDVIARNEHETSETLAEALLSEIRDLDHPEQDNVSLGIVKITQAEGKRRRLAQRDAGYLAACDTGKSDFKKARRGLPGLRASLSRFLPVTSGSVD